MAYWSPGSTDDGPLAYNTGPGYDAEAVPSAPLIPARPRSRSNPYSHSQVCYPTLPTEETSSMESTGSVEDRGLTLATPTGDDIMRHFKNRSIVYLIPKEAIDGCPLTVSGGGNVQGGGSFTDESKFEVYIPRKHPTECVVALRNVKHSGKYLCINRDGKTKTRNGYKDSCDLFVTAVGDASSPVVCFESAQTEGYFLGIHDNAVVKASTITARSNQAHFFTRLDIPSRDERIKLRVFGRNSIMNQFPDQTVIRLFSHKRYLAIDKKGNVCQTHNSENKDGWFNLFDRAMGIYSLQSHKYPGLWLRLQEGKGLVAKMLGPDSFFTVKESENQLICFEAVRRAGLFIAPPLGNPSIKASIEFTLEHAQPRQ